MSKCREVRGTALAASLPEPRPFIVFATAFDNYGLDAIAVDATDYLLKPVSRAKLAATLDRVRARLATQTRRARHRRGDAGAVAHVAGFAAEDRRLRLRGRLAAGTRRRRRFLRRLSRSTSRRPGRLLLGDASGKGVAAGLVASAVQARVNTAARLAHLKPEELMAAVDRDVYATTDGARYATAIYGVLDTRLVALTLVNAGHPPVLCSTRTMRSWHRDDGPGAWA